MAKKSTTYKGRAKPYGKSGHFNESRRHSLQAKGIKTGRNKKWDFYTGAPTTKSQWKNRAWWRGYTEAREGVELPENTDVLAKSYLDGYEAGKKKEAWSDMDEYELKPKFDNAKSFHDKASVRREDGKTILKSYDTDVAYIEDGKAHISGTYSATTLRHIKEFLKQNGFKAESKKQIVEDYGGG